MKEKCLFVLVLLPETVKKCLSRMSRKLLRTVLRRGRESNLSPLVEFTSYAFIKVLKDSHVEISMDGQGRWRGDIYVKRLWRSLKYEEIYLKAYENVRVLKIGVSRYFRFYNRRRFHQALSDRTPE